MVHLSCLITSLIRSTGSHTDAAAVLTSALSDFSIATPCPLLEHHKISQAVGIKQHWHTDSSMNVI